MCGVYKRASSHDMYNYISWHHVLYIPHDIIFVRTNGGPIIENRV